MHIITILVGGRRNRVQFSTIHWSIKWNNVGEMVTILFLFYFSWNSLGFRGLADLVPGSTLKRHILQQEWKCNLHFFFSSSSLHFWYRSFLSVCCFLDVSSFLLLRKLCANSSGSTLNGVSFMGVKGMTGFVEVLQRTKFPCIFLNVLFRAFLFSIKIPMSRKSQEKLCIFWKIGTARNCVSYMESWRSHIYYSYSYLENSLLEQTVKAM